MNDSELLKRIVLNPEVLNGKPAIQNTRLSVDFILNLLAHGSSQDDILKEYENLSREDIQACILFAVKSLENTDYMPLLSEKNAG